MSTLSAVVLLFVGLAKLSLPGPIGSSFCFGLGSPTLGGNGASFLRRISNTYLDPFWTPNAVLVDIMVELRRLEVLRHPGLRERYSTVNLSLGLNDTISTEPAGTEHRVCPPAKRQTDGPRTIMCFSIKLRNAL
ncbi:hypothetical protein V8C44DRAFT_345319 [Trichoderma aethiopicum]